MECAIKLTVELSSDDKHVIEGQMKICNWVYNSLLEKANQLRDHYIRDQDADAAKTLYS